MSQPCDRLCELCVKRGYTSCVNTAQTTQLSVEMDAAGWHQLYNRPIPEGEGFEREHIRVYRAMAAVAPVQLDIPAKSIDMVLFCPNCGLQHIDAPEIDMQGEPADDWDNPPHRSHLCHGCGYIWRPADVPTNGVEKIQTSGKADSALAYPPRALRVRIESVLNDALYGRATPTQIENVLASLRAAHPAQNPPQLDASGAPKIEMTLIERKAVEILNTLKAAADGGLIHLPEGVRMQIDVILMTAAQRRIGVA